MATVRRVPQTTEAGFGCIIASSSSVSNTSADYTCTGTADETTINTAINTLTNGGEVKLLDGTYNLTAPINIPDDVILTGSGNGATLINQATPDQPALYLNDADRCGVRDLQIKIPTNSTSNAITIDDSTGYHLHRLEFQGGGSGSWMVHDNAGFDFHYQHLKGSQDASWRGGGLQFTNDSEYNSGNALVEYFEYMMRYSDTTGIYINGTDAPGKNVNLIQFTALNIVNFQGTATGTKAIHLHRAGYCTFSMLDIEAHETGIYFEESGRNTFTGLYVSGNTTGVLNDAASACNTFIGGHVGDTITDNQANEAYQLKLYGGDYGTTA